MSATIWLTILWKVAGGAFFILNGITHYWQRASGVQKAEISSARSVRGTYQYPFKRSNLLKNFTSPILSLKSSILRIGYESVFEHWLTFLKSVTNLYEPSGFGTRIHGELHSLLLGSINMLFSNIYSITYWDVLFLVGLLCKGAFDCFFVTHINIMTSSIGPTWDIRKNILPFVKQLL